MLTNVLSIVYVWKVIEIAYFKTTSGKSTEIKEAPLSMLIPIWILVGANYYFGIATDLTVSSALSAAKELMGTPL